MVVDINIYYLYNHDIFSNHLVYLQFRDKK
jgi:hypothetical protein